MTHTGRYSDGLPRSKGRTLRRISCCLSWDKRRGSAPPRHIYYLWPGKKTLSSTICAQVGATQAAKGASTNTRVNVRAVRPAEEAACPAVLSGPPRLPNLLNQWAATLSQSAPISLCYQLYFLTVSVYHLLAQRHLLEAEQTEHVGGRAGRLSRVPPDSKRTRSVFHCQM